MAATTKVWVDGASPTCNAVDLNGFKTENNNLIQGAGLVLNTANNQQSHEAVAIYAGAGDYFIGGGAANVYTLTAVGSRIAPTVLSEGLMVRFVCPVTNTGPSTIETVSGWAAENLLDSDGNALTGGELIAGQGYAATYDGSDFRISATDGNFKNRLVITSNIGPTLIDTETPLAIGSDDLVNDPHLCIGPAIVQAKMSESVPALLNLNPLGGTVFLGAAGPNPGGFVLITGNSLGQARLSTDENRAYLHYDADIRVQSAGVGAGLEVDKGNGMFEVLTVEDFRSQAADLSVTNSTVLQNTDLTFSGLEPGVYALYGFFKMASGVAAGIQLSMATKSGTVIEEQSLFLTTDKIESPTPGAPLATLATSDTDQLFEYIWTNTSVARVQYTGTFEVTATAEVGLEFTQSNSSANTSTFERGSWLRIRKVA